MSNAEIFRKAANYLRDHGWAQGDFKHSDGTVCAWGALNIAQGKPAHSHQFTEVDQLVEARFDHGRYGLADWNDEPERTPEEVVAFLESLAFDEDLKAAATTIDTTIPTSVQITQPSPTLLKEAVSCA